MEGEGHDSRLHEDPTPEAIRLRAAENGEFGCHAGAGRQPSQPFINPRTAATLSEDAGELMGGNNSRRLAHRRELSRLHGGVLIAGD